MGKAKVRWILLCEDRAQEQFFRRVGEGLGLRGKIRVVVAPEAENASAWILAQYPKWASRLIRERGQPNLALLVVIDGDQLGHAERRRQLRSRLEHAALSIEPIARKVVFEIPTWNIETWLGFLGAEATVAESIDYKRGPRADWLPAEPKLGRPSKEWHLLMKKAADRFVELLREPDPRAAGIPQELPALIEGLVALKRLGI